MKTLFSLPLSIGAGFVASIVLVAFTVYAWTGPTSAPPDGNVSAPINVGTVNQVKNAGLSVNALTVFGNQYVQGSMSIGTTDFFSATPLTLQLDQNAITRVDIVNNNTGASASAGVNFRTNGQTFSGQLFQNGPSGSSSYGGANSLNLFNLLNAPLAFGTNGLERVRITAAGNVGIGTTNPTGLLQVGSEPPVSPRLGPIGGGYITVADNPYGYSIIAGRILATTYFNSDSYWLAGSCWNAYGGCPSDVRLKDHIRPFEPGLAAVLGINPIYYRYNGLGGTPKSDHDLLGVLAQDVEMGAPELVTTESVKLHSDDTKETDIKKLDTSGLQYLLVNAVKELYARWASDSADVHAQLEAQQAEIDALKKEVEMLKAR